MGKRKKRKRKFIIVLLTFLSFQDLLEKKMGYHIQNIQFSEYIGCHIMETLGLSVQETVLGKYVEDNKEKIVVACKVFTNEEKILV